MPTVSKSAPPQSSAPAKLADAGEVRQQLVGKHVCPFCGVMRADPHQPCPRCTLDDNTATRSATRQRIGPWFVLQARNPSAPGMKLLTLQSLIRKGHLTPRSIVRGPTTDQMWAFAANVRGLSREFGLCFHCGENVDPTATQCPHCGRGQLLPADSDALLEHTDPPAAQTQQTPPAYQPPAPQSPPLPPADFLSGVSARRSDTGMEGGTSLDLQADSVFSQLPAFEIRPAVPAGPIRPTALQRAPVPAKEESILTARELAAAFQLDFKPPPNTNRAKRPRRPVRTLFSLLLIGLVAGAIVLGLRPDWRQTSFAWATEKWSELAASLERPAKPPQASAPPTQIDPVRTPARDVPPPTPTRQPPVPPADSSPPPTPPPTANVPPPEARVEPRIETPKPLVVAPPAPTPLAPPPVAVPAPELTPVPDDLNMDQATQLASELRLKAIDAQARNDWPLALRCYEQIQRLPREAWPADLPLRLDMARRRAANP